MNNLVRIIGCVILFAGVVVWGLGSQEDKKSEFRFDIDSAGGVVQDLSGQVVQAAGRVRLVGSGTFPELIISGKDREWYIDKKDEAVLKDYQQQTLTVAGTETYTDLRFANGLPAGRRYTLHDITIIKIAGVDE
jgi:hypothetical protein